MVEPIRRDVLRHRAGAILSWATRCTLTGAALPRKEALGEGGNKARLYDQPNKCLERGQYGKRVIHRDVAREEPTPVETGHTEHESAEW